MKTLTEVYKEGIEELIEDIVDCFSGESISYHAGQIRTKLNKNTLTLLQSEHDRLEGEKIGMPEECVTQKDRYYAMNNTGYNNAIQDQQTYLLEQIKEIKDL